VLDAVAFRPDYAEMLGFGRAKNAKVLEEVVTLEDRIVEELDQEFLGWREDQKDAFAQVLCRLLPKIAAESGGLGGLPFDRVVAVLKRNFWRFLPRLLMDREKAMSDLGRAFMTRGRAIRAFCARTAQTIPELQTKEANDNGQPL
jgi:hypothetical protein